MTLVSKKQARAEHLAWCRRRDLEHAIAWTVVLVIVITTFGLIFWPLWLLAFPAGAHLYAGVRKIRAGAHDAHNLKQYKAAK